jgi:hypothetical protein
MVASADMSTESSKPASQGTIPFLAIGFCSMRPFTSALGSLKGLDRIQPADLPLMTFFYPWWDIVMTVDVDTVVGKEVGR